MNVVLLCGGLRLPVTVPAEDSDHAVATIACPSCARDPLRVQGRENHIAPDDRAYEARAICLACGETVGTLRAEPDTLFGLTEDARVLRGRARVY